MTKELELLKQVCEEMGLPWIDETGESIIDGIPASQWFKTHTLFPRAAHFNDENLYLNFGLYYMGKIRSTRWRGEDKANFVSGLYKERARIRRIKNERRRKPHWSMKSK